MAWFDDVWAAMDAQGVSVLQLATAAGVHRQTVYGWLNGAHRPEAHHVEVIALVLGFDYEKLLFDVAHTARPRRGRGNTREERIADLERQIAEQQQLVDKLRQQGRE